MNCKSLPLKMTSVCLCYFEETDGKYFSSYQIKRASDKNSACPFGVLLTRFELISMVPETIILSIELQKH